MILPISTSPIGTKTLKKPSFGKKITIYVEERLDPDAPYSPIRLVDKIVDEDSREAREYFEECAARKLKNKLYSRIDKSRNSFRLIRR